MEIENFISDFRLDSIDTEWVDAVWDKEFMEVGELPGKYMNEEEFDLVVQALKTELKRIISSGSSDDRGQYSLLWDVLGPQIRSLLPVIYYFIKQGTVCNDGNEESEETDSRIISLSAASLYYILLAIPGSSAYKVFRRLLFEAALDTFKFSSLLKDETSNKRRGQNDDTFDEDGACTLFYGQKCLLAEALNSSLSDLLCFLKSFSLKDKSDSFELTVQILTSLTLVDCKISPFNLTNCQTSKNNPSTSERLERLLRSLATNAYVALHLLAKGRLQESKIPCVELVLDNLLPGLAWGGSEGTARERTAMRQNVLRFVKQCLLPISREEDHFDDTILTLVRHLCGAAVRMPADVRRMVAGTIMELTKEMPNVTPVLDWIIKFSRSDRSNHRLMSVELLSGMLLKSKDMNHLQDVLPQIINGLVARFQDVSPTVCGRALSAIADCSALKCAMTVISSLFEKELVQDEKDVSLPPLTEGEILVTELLERTTDPRAMVRRSALQVTGNLMEAFPLMYRRPLLLTLKHHCLDPSPMVRKQVLQSLTNIVANVTLDFSEHADVRSYIEDVEESWLRGVLPQVCDRDPKVREKALELLQNLLLYGKDSGGGSPSPNWHLIRRMETLRLLPFLSEACSAWSMESKPLGKDLWPQISKQLEGQHQYSAWLLLSTISEHFDLPDAVFIMNYYMRYSQHIEEVSVVEECICILIFRVLGRVSSDLPIDALKSLKDNLLEKISDFSFPVSVIRPAIDALYLISRKVSEVSAAEIHLYVPSWGPQIIQSCEQFVTSALQLGLGEGRGRGRVRQDHGWEGRQWTHGEGQDKDHTALAKRMLTMADVALICPGVVKNSTVAVIQSILFPQNMSNARGRDELKMPTPQLCSIAVVVLGKLCLQDARLAARVVPTLGSLLQQPPAAQPPPLDPAWAPLRNNVMCALSDMCRSFAQLVDPLLPKMSACLHSSDVTLRENALVLLVQLLQEDYLKVRRGALLFDLLTALNDEEIAVSQLASYYLGRCLVHSQHSIMYQNVIPALFHYNHYQGHETYKVYGVDGSSRCEGVFHSTNEEDQKVERRNIFRFMMQHLSDEQKQNVIGRICHEVLGGVVNGKVSLDLDEGCQLLADAIWMLTSEEIRPSGLKNNEEENDEEAGTVATLEELPNDVAVPGTSDKEPPSKRKKGQFPGLQKEMLDVLLPIAVALMQKLEKVQSPLLFHLMEFLKHTFKEYKIDVGDLAAGDKELLDAISRNLKSLQQK